MSTQSKGQAQSIASSQTVRGFPTTIKIKTPRDDIPFPVFNKPSITGCFSLDSQRKYIPGPMYLKFLKLPSSLDDVHFDLDELNQRSGSSKDPSQPQSDASEDNDAMHKETNELVHLLNWIHFEGEGFMRRKPHFVFYRGLMTKILGTPYESREGWKVGAMLKNGTIYLRNIDTPESVQDRIRQRTDPRSRRMTSWGYNFEHFLLADGPQSDPTPDVTEKNECNFVFQTKLESHELLYAAEIDGVWLPSESDMNPKAQPELLNKCNLVELKTTRAFPNGRMTRNFCKFNLRKWFCQSYTVGISHVVAGLRDDDGIVHELKLFPVKELSDLRVEWSSNVCFKFLELFLTEVKQVVRNHEQYVFIFEFDPQASNHFSKDIRISVQNIGNSDLYLSNIK